MIKHGMENRCLDVLFLWQVLAHLANICKRINEKTPTDLYLILERDSGDYI